MSDRKVPRVVRMAAVVALVFGVLTVGSGAATLFGGADMGAVVPFVLWFNFIAGFAYIAAGLGLWVGRRWAWVLSIVIFAATSGVAVAFAIYAWQGAAYELRTVGALLLRTVTWAAIAAVGARLHSPDAATSTAADPPRM
jgi:hypothetical protein